ncbi:hypothetical protein M422DRAFT_30792 [Sphaerobolus stellatus SS14]|uniref:N-acetyltransferase domain-containing protein n=1 Tax=Sphaerobolus stellatus (strain SS14) TaxID=990650 RepID=A0A0C9UKC4_SPHS4|nr:hypothetical protein M422DRAFT_30792 [Sphaerobolus stellatus SS14]
MFCFPVTPTVLSDERVVLEPFDLSIHGEQLFNSFLPHPELFTYLPWGPFPTLSAFHDWHHKRIASDPGSTLFAVFPAADASGAAPAIAGMIGLLNSSYTNASTELGYIILNPKHHATRLAHRAVRLLLHWCLDVPSEVEGTLGLRRVEWQAHTANVRSARVAERMGFVKEGVIRWNRVLPVEKVGVGRGEEKEDAAVASERLKLRMGDGKPGRSSVLLSLCWDDWEDRVREHVDKLVETFA